MNNYVVLKNLETPDKRQTLQRAIEWLGQAIDVTSRGIRELRTTVAEDWTEEKKKELHDIYKVMDEIIMRLYFEVAHEKNQANEPIEEISDELRCRFYERIKPLMKQIIDFAEEDGVMFAQTAHYFMQLLTSFLRCNPKEVLHLAKRRREIK